MAPETLTAPLSQAASAALSRLERAFAVQPAMSAADVAAHEAASYVRRPALVGAHDKAKEPQLPTRPRGPHPHLVGGA